MSDIYMAKLFPILFSLRLVVNLDAVKNNGCDKNTYSTKHFSCYRIEQLLDNTFSLGQGSQLVKSTTAEPVS